MCIWIDEEWSGYSSRGRCEKDSDYRDGFIVSPFLCQCLRFDSQFRAGPLGLGQVKT
ncbi:hypothetical protein AMATHDRAFT_64592 [Amanita thiersii Skay4041]|uniref:Uncharacterized protein n=1 Tax=Amanita thiersii Skay4041 TaxID=703135 RepID=A0A2A9NKI2_9AGAR|nr:hypothetical protein AMATHDRAFT_64592 [Amanita thiersii Skay4041]